MDQLSTWGINIEGDTAQLQWRARACAIGFLPTRMPCGPLFDQDRTFGLKWKVLAPTPAIDAEEIPFDTGAGGGARRFAWSRRPPARRNLADNERQRWGCRLALPDAEGRR